MEGASALPTAYTKTCDGKSKLLTDTVVANTKQFDITRSLRGSTEAKALCLDCKQIKNTSAVRELTKIVNTTGDISSICFYASFLRKSDLKSKKNPESYYNCKSKNTKIGAIKSEYPDDKNRKTTFCANKDYIEMTAKAFNEVANCFKFTHKEKKLLFALFNHESRFVLNARSPTRTRCYGQLTITAIKDINRNIFLRNDGGKSKIYDKVKSQCPGLADKVIPPGVLKVPKQETSYNQKEDELAKIQRRNNFTCGTTQDPYICMFYSMFYAQMNMDFFDKSFSAKTHYRHREPAPGIRKALGISEQKPIQLNEMLVIKGPITINGVTRVRKWVFWDNAEVFNLFNRHRISAKQARNLEVKRVKIFDEDMLRAKFIQTGHNGGTSITYSEAGTFVRELKRKIAYGKECKKDKNCKKMRETILSKKSLSVDTFNHEWSNFAHANSLVNVGEVHKFAKKIDADINTMQEKNPADSIIDKLPKDVSSLLTSDQKQEFISQIQESCPKTGYGH